MKKVKIFRLNDVKEFEETINQFIKDKKVIDMKYRTDVAESGAGGIYTNTFYDSAMIIYEE